MKLFTLFAPVIPFFTGICQKFSGEPTTERKKLTALLLALRSAHEIMNEIIDERQRFNAAIGGAKRIVRSHYRIMCNPRTTIRRLNHWIDRASDTISLLSEVTPENEDIGYQCVEIVEAMAAPGYLAKLAEALASSKKMRGCEKNVVQLEDSLSNFRSAIPSLLAA